MKEQGHRYPNVTDDLSWDEAKIGSVGMPAIWNSLKHLGRYVDVPQALKASLKMNQEGGFDCPGCAWPDPDDDRSKLGEYLSLIHI